jgi:hypothetical protein
VARRRQDAEKIFAEAEAEKMTGSGYAWIVTEQATSFYLILVGSFWIWI